MREILRGAALLPGGQVEDDVFLAFEDGRVVEVRAGRPGDPRPTPGLLVPGLVNAHTHLELSWRGLVPGGQGFVAWVGALMAAERPDATPRQRAAASAAATLVELGVAAVSDLCGEGSTAEVLLRAGLAGVAQVELLGFDRERATANAARAADLPTRHGRDVFTRAAAHAPYSTAPDLIQAALHPPGPAWPPGSIHLAEDQSETDFLADGSGPFATLLDRLGVAWGWWTPPGLSPVAYLDRLGVLGPDTLVVHAVHIDGSDRARLAATATPVCLCPRSNLHIGGTLADAPALLAAGVPLCLGTDSLASSPDLDLLGELPVLASAFPEIPVATWLGLATEGGARALRLPSLGRFAVGSTPGAVLLEADLAGLRRSPPARRWLVQPGHRPLELA